MMPNWIENRIVVEGESDVLLFLHDHMEGDADGDGRKTPIDFRCLWPRPLTLYDAIDDMPDDVKLRLYPLLQKAAVFPTFSQWVDDVAHSQHDKDMLALALDYPLGDWCKCHWGSGPAVEGKKLICDGKLWLRFNTAWTPPVGLYRNMCEEWPSLTFSGTWCDIDDVTPMMADNSFADSFESCDHLAFFTWGSYNPDGTWSEGDGQCVPLRLPDAMTSDD